jgi:hypothetical protein
MQAQCLGVITSTELASVPSDRPMVFTEQLRLAVAAYLAAEYDSAPAMSPAIPSVYM